MKNLYFKKSALALGLAALATTGAFAEDGSWSQINALKNAAFIPGWCGALTASADGVAEAWDAPFELYQFIEDAPAGQYTLTVNAFYRFGTNDYAEANMADGANHNAYIFLGDAKTAVTGLFDNAIRPALINEEEGIYEEFDATKHSPNSTYESNLAFEAGRYVNTVTFDHKGGNLYLGIGCAEYRQDQWVAFDNFKLEGPDGVVELVNGDFAQGIENANGVWEMTNIGNSVKTVDMNKDGGANGCYRKTNASPYNFGQLVELPAGKYRFGVQSFYRDGNGNQSGWYIQLKGFAKVEGESSYDRHVAGTEDTSLFPLIYVVEDVDGLKPLDSTDVEYAVELGKVGIEKAVKCIFDEELDYYPDNNPKVEEVAEGEHGYADSGYENEAAQVFVKNPELYRNYIEFELSEPSKVWVGLKKDSNTPSNYWNAFRDFTLEKWVGENTGVSNIASDDENAPVEYYNLQGIRVANPENGVFIVKQGKKVSKTVIR